MKITYNFELDGTEQEKSIYAQNYSFCRACGNCKYYWYDRQHPRKGFCKWPIKMRKVKQTEETASLIFSKTHVFCVCDYHKFRSRKWSFDYVTKWVGKFIKVNPNV